MPASAYQDLANILEPIAAMKGCVTIVSVWKAPLLALSPLGFPTALVLSHHEGTSPEQIIERGMTLWQGAALREKEKQKRMAQEQLKKLDINHDGSISPEEWQRAFVDNALALGGMTMGQWMSILCEMKLEKENLKKENLKKENFNLNQEAQAGAAAEAPTAEAASAPAAPTLVNTAVESDKPALGLVLRLGTFPEGTWDATLFEALEHEADQRRLKLLYMGPSYEDLEAILEARRRLDLDLLGRQTSVIVISNRAERFLRRIF